MWLNRFKIRTRIYAGFATLVLLGVALAGFGVYRLSDIRVEVGKMDALQRNIPGVLRVSRNLEAIRRSERSYLFDPSDRSLQELSEERRRLYREVRDALAAQDQKLDQFEQLAKTTVDERAGLFTGAPPPMA